MQNLRNYAFKKDRKVCLERNYFSDLQFGFKEGVGCIEASFTILETITLLKGEEKSLHAI